MRVKKDVKAGGMRLNHNEKQVSKEKTKSLRVKTNVKAGDGINRLGSGITNHNETLVEAA